MEQNTLALLEEMEAFQHSVVAGLDKILNEARRWDETAQSREKTFSEAQWHLGEAQARSQHLEDDLQGKARYIQELEERCRTVQRQFEESQWYLGEERYRKGQLETALAQTEARCRDLESQLNQLRGNLQPA